MTEQAKLIEDPQYGIEDGHAHVEDLMLHVIEPSDDLVNSIQMYGVLEPIIIDTANVVIDGRRRVAACRQLGIEQIPYRMVVSQDGNGQIDRPTVARLALTSHATRHANVLTELQAIESLIEAGYSEPQIIETTGLNVNTFRRRLRLRNLNANLRHEFESGKLAVTTAEAAAKLDGEAQKRLVKHAGPDKITGAMVRAVKERQVESAYDALEIPGFDEIPTADDVGRDVLVVRHSAMTALYDAVFNGELYRAMDILKVMMPGSDDPPDETGD